MAKKPKRHELFSHEARVAGGRRRAGNPRPILPQRHLFVTEGTKTEPNYLNGMIDQICTCYGASCRKQFVVYGEGDNTLGLLTKAEKHLINEPDGFQHVWILYDQDDFPKDRFDNAEQCFFRRTCRRKKQISRPSVVCRRRNSARLLLEIRRICTFSTD